MADRLRRMLVLVVLVAAAAGLLWVLKANLPRLSGYSLFDFLAGKAPPAFAPEQYSLPESAPLAAGDVPILERLNAEYAKLAAAVVPSVVSIDTRETVAVQSPFPGYYRQLQRPGLGSGVIVTPEGHVLTNHHVVANKDAIRITCTSGEGRRESFAADFVGSLPAYDLAVLKIRSNRGGFPALKLGDSNQVHPGQLVFAVGNPYGLAESVTQGIISGIDRRLSDAGATYYLQTDTPINPGNSGGPLVNHRGEVIGINTVVYRGSQKDQSAQNIGFAIPSNQAMEAFQIITGRGRPVTGYLGLVVSEVTPRAAAFLGLEEVQGLLVEGLLPQGPAARCGLRPLDVILSVDGRPVASRDAFLAGLRSTLPGTQVKLAVWRERALVPLTATVGDAREVTAEPALPADGEAGPESSAVDKSSRQESLGWLRSVGIGVGVGPDGSSLRVEAVAPAGLAAGRVLPGDLLVSVNGSPVSSPASFNQALIAARGAPELRIVVDRNGSRREVVVPVR